MYRGPELSSVLKAGSRSRTLTTSPPPGRGAPGLVLVSVDKVVRDTEHTGHVHGRDSPRTRSGEKVDTGVPRSLRPAGEWLSRGGSVRPKPKDLGGHGYATRWGPPPLLSTL